MGLTLVTDIGDPHYDDPSLALMFRQLKSKSLQTAKGSSEISGQTEFNFVLHTANVFRRMGCHILALDLVQKWHFDRPTMRAAPPAVNGSPVATHKPLSSMFAIHPRRMKSLSIDMELPSMPPTRAASPIPEVRENGTPAPPAADAPPPPVPENAARKAGFGSLMKTAKQDVSVPEFSMDAFF